MFCSRCGNALESTARFCPHCGASRAVAGGPLPGQLVRPRSPRMIAGVCAGFAEHYGWDLGLVRLVAVCVTLLTGVTFFFYLAAWIILPEGQYALPPPLSPGTAPTESTSH